MQKRHEFIEESRKQWSSEPAFVASMAAAAVGLGNLWRFPYMVGENGAGAFVVAYLLALVVVVLPIMILEVSAGRLSEGSTVYTYRQANRFGAVYGWFVVLITMAITSYYLVITGWTLGYAVDAVTDDLRVFGDFTAGYNSLWYFFGVTVLAAIILAIGQGYLVTYGSFIPRKTHVPRACVIVAGTETSVALLAGWMIFPFVFSLGMQPTEGSQLAFMTMPPVFEDMAGGYWVGMLFFGLFFLAAFSSSLAGLKVIIAAVAEEFKLSNGRAVSLVTLVMLVLGAAMFCWFIPPGKIRAVLGTESRWWEWRIYLVGRYLPLVMLFWIVVTYALNRAGFSPV